MHDKDVYLTAEGRSRFAAELQELTTVRRAEVEARLRQAKEFADAAKSAEYDEMVTEQAVLEGRIRELERILATAHTIEETPKSSHVRLGCRVTVEDESGERDTYHIVGSQEADPRKRKVSNESPIGRALLGKRVGDEVVVVAPAGSFRLRILAIE